LPSPCGRRNRRCHAPHRSSLRHDIIQPSGKMRVCVFSAPSVGPGPTERPLYVAHRPVEDARAILGFSRIHSITDGCRTAWGLFLRKRYPPGYPSCLHYLAAAVCPVSRRYTSLRSSDSIQGKTRRPTHTGFALLWVQVAAEPLHKSTLRVQSWRWQLGVASTSPAAV